MHKNLLKTSLAVAVLAQMALPVLAADQPQKLKEVVVRDVPIEQDILPTSRPFSSVYGTDLSIMDTPRNVTIISREQLSAIDIQNVRDFTKLTTSSYTGNNFGAPTTPNIRGQIADSYINGMRKGLTSNGNGLPINFNSIESVNIIKGPGSVVQGASQYTGGAVDFVTKRPFFDKFQGDLAFTYGSYDTKRWTLDFGGPVNKELAYRVSYSGEDSGSYYDDSGTKMQAFYEALSWTPTDDFTLDFNNEFVVYDYTENFGINRVTQNLIDHQLYQTGEVVGQYKGGFSQQFGTFVPNDFPVGDSRNVHGNNNVIDPGPLVKISRSARNHNPTDGSTATSYYAQLIANYKVDPDFNISNNTLVNYIDRKTRSSYMYNELLKDNLALENRTEFRLNFDTTVIESTKGGGETMKDSKSLASVVKTPKSEGYSIGNSVNTGLAMRFQDNTNYDDYFNEPANAWDLTKPYSKINYQNFGFIDLPIPGGPSNYVFNPGSINGDSFQSTFYEVGPFYQHNMKLTDKLSLLFGGRADIQFINYNDPPGTIPVLYHSDSVTLVEKNLNVSPTYKLAPWATTYFTYNYSESNYTGNGGSYGPGGGANFSSTDYHRPSELIEGGFKFNLLKDSLFVGVAVFNQTIEVPSLGGGSSSADVNGLEIEANYQPNKNFYATVGYSFLDATVDDAGQFFVQTGPLASFPVAGYPNALLSDYGTLGKRGYALGMPKHTANALLTYKFDNGLGASVGAVVTSEQKLSYTDNTHIPLQFSLDLSAFYVQPRYEVRFGITNLTDEKNVSPAGSGFQVGRIYNYDGIVFDTPISLEGTVKFKF